MIEVVLVDDEALIRESVRMILEAAEGIDVVGECHSERNESSFDPPH